MPPVTSIATAFGRARQHADVVVVLCGALALRVGCVLATRDLPLRDDSADYVRLGKLLADGRGFGETALAAGGGPTAFRAPGYPLFLGAVFRLTGDSITAARLLQAGLGTVTVALVGVAAWQLWGRRSGVIAAAIAAAYPPLVLVGSAVLTEAISLPLQMLVLVLALEHRRRADRGVVLPAACGALIGLCILTRPANMALVIPICLLLAAGRSLRSRARPSALVLVALAVVLVPWQIRNQRAFDELVPLTTTDGFIVAGVYNDAAAHDPDRRAVWRPPIYVPGQAELFDDPSLDELELSEELRELGTEYAKENPGYVAVVVATNFAHLFDLNSLAFPEVGHHSEGYGAGSSRLWTVSYWILALVAVAGLVTRPARRAPPAVWLIPVFYVLATVPTLGTARYRAPIEPFLVLLATAAIVVALDRWGPARIDARARSIR